MSKAENNRPSTFQLLRNRFPEGEYVLIQEVSDASGFARSRSLDYMLINLWQSGGPAITGIEKKTFRGDWLKELKNPQKQENHYKFCDYFYLLTDKEDVAKIEEIPGTWGWYHINKSGILKTMKVAPKLKPNPVTRSFLCAMLRRAASKDKYVHEDTIEERIKASAEKIQGERNYNLERDAREYLQLRKNVDDFEKASGLDITHSWPEDLPQKMGEAVRIIMNNQHLATMKTFDRILQSAKDICDSVESKINAFKASIENKNNVKEV